MREHTHVQAVQVVRLVGVVAATLLQRQVLHALLDECLGLRVQLQCHTQCTGCALACVVVGRGADATGRKHHVATGKGTPQGHRDAIRVIAHVLGVIE